MVLSIEINNSYEAEHEKAELVLGSAQWRSRVVNISMHMETI